MLTNRIELVTLRNEIVALPLSGDVITINGNNIKLDYPIQTTFLLGDKIIVLYDPDSYIPKFGQFQNLIALDIMGNEVWKAELPTTSAFSF